MKVVKTEMFDIYIQGEPVITGGEDGVDEWFKYFSNNYKDGSGVAEYLANVLKNTTGLFSLIVKYGNEFILASDIVRSFPLFYGFNNKGLFITDQLEQYQKENGKFKIDDNNLTEFCTAGFTLGNVTVYQEVYGLKPGEVVTVSRDKIRSIRYFNYVPAQKPKHFKSLNDMAVELDNVLLSCFRRMIELNPKVNRWVVPLSGGHDSRLIVNYLYRLGVKNVLCFSYGKPNNVQSSISNQVADAVGYEWHFVEYTEQKWQALHDSGLFDDYLNFSFNGVSVTHFQDFLAVYELKEKKIIREGDIFVPGHTAVTSRYKKEYGDYNTIGEALLDAYNNDLVVSPIIKNNDVSKKLGEIGGEYFDDDLGIIRAYLHWQEKHTKFIINSLKVYDFFGFKRMLPLWDKGFADFWLACPSIERVGRELLFQVEESVLLKDPVKSIPFAVEKTNNSVSLFKKGLKELLPQTLISLLLQMSNRKDKTSEGANQLFALHSNTVKELLEPLDDFPDTTLPYFKSFLDRSPYRMNVNRMTLLYTMRKLLDKNKVSYD